MKYIELLWKNNICHECHSEEDVKAIEIGSNCIILCKNCREKLKELLQE